MYLQGRLGIESSPELGDQLFAILRRQSPPETLFIDFEAVSYMGTSGIATLIDQEPYTRFG
jgi:anti-anti-sigma regulatory factor